MSMALKAPRSGDGVPGCSVAGWLEVDLNRAGVVQEPDDIRATRGGVRGISQGGAQWHAVSYLA